MLNSKELRTKAWNSLNGKYWMALGVTVVTGLIYGLGESIISLGSNILQIPTMVNPAEMDSVMITGAAVVTGMGLVALCIGLILSIFVGYPIIVGGCKYFIRNTDSKPSFSEAFSGYKISYGRNIRTLFLVDLKLLLWLMIFIVPGIIKGFEYVIIPYILADDPEISTRDAFIKAKEMMKGNRWRLFKLNFSFIGWYLLSILTCGVGVLFLLPYVEAANAEFYVDLKNN